MIHRSKKEQKSKQIFVKKFCILLQKQFFCPNIHILGFLFIFMEIPMVKPYNLEKSVKTEFWKKCMKNGKKFQKMCFTKLKKFISICN